jgi:hypothetical protein
MITTNLKEIAATVHAANESRCACGRRASWEHYVSGGSSRQSCIWAGCPKCSGAAIGTPLLRRDYAAWRKLDLLSQRKLIAVAAICRVWGDIYDPHVFPSLGRDKQNEVTVRFGACGAIFYRTVFFRDDSTILAEDVEE